MLVAFLPRNPRGGARTSEREKREEKETSCLVGGCLIQSWEEIKVPKRQGHDWNFRWFGKEKEKGKEAKLRK